jgi:hypothetical protein
MAEVAYPSSNRRYGYHHGELWLERRGKTRIMCPLKDNFDEADQTTENHCLSCIWLREYGTFRLLTAFGKEENV